MDQISAAYDYRNCSSLFGYSAGAHRRSGGVCQLCGAGGNSFDFWRQLTVEHIIGQSQGGYLAQIRRAVSGRFPEMSKDDVEHLARELDEMNTVTACSFCNSTTSRMEHRASMDELIKTTGGEPEDVRDVVAHTVSAVLAVKKKTVAWKLRSVRRAFEEQVLDQLSEWQRSEE